MGSFLQAKKRKVMWVRFLQINEEKSGCPSNSCPLNLVLPPPPKRAQNEEKLYKNQYKILKIDTFFRGGERNFVDKTILWTFGRFLRINEEK